MQEKNTSPVVWQSKKYQTDIVDKKHSMKRNEDLPLSNAGKSVLVVGGARSGVAVAKLLRMMEYHVTLTDQQVVLEKEELLPLGIDVFDGGHPDQLIRKYDFVVKNPGIPLTNPFIKSLIEVENEIVNEIEAASHFTHHFIYGAITGTNGKTTTTSLLHAFLLKKDERALVAGNIGIPLSSLVMEEKSKETAESFLLTEYVDVAIELSSFQLQTMPTFQPFVSVILNLTPDHLDYHSSLEEYYQAKTNIYRNMDETGYFLRNVDDPSIMQYVKDLPCQILNYSMKHCSFMDEDDENIEIDIYLKDAYVYLRDVRLFDVRDMKLVGEHNIQNAMVSASMAYLMGVTPKQIQETLREFRGVEHRLEFVRELNNVFYYNDSKGTNVDAAKIALSSFPGNIIWLAGGKDKRTGYEELRPYLDRVKLLIAFGEAKEALADLMKSDDKPQRFSIVDNLEEAVLLAYQLGLPGDVVLLSPACSSFDQFKNFEERGQVFKTLVNRLSQDK